MPTSRSSKPNIVITMGDPSGIGPEVILKALARPKIRELADFLVIGDGLVLNETSRRIGVKVNFPVLDLSNIPPRAFSYGKAHPRFGRASIQYIDRALELLKSGRADCLVTAPVNKRSVRLAGIIDFEGHTEYLASKTRTKDYAMMFVGRSLKITLVTRHLRLKDVPNTISKDAIYKAILLTSKYLKKYFKISRPKIGVAGLNPHAGEGGIFGKEEKGVIIPAIKKANRSMGGLSGPIPPDVIFYDAINKKFDAVVAMYHDQGLIPFKLLYFKDGVNLTLGLPFVRTSPDHGTAFDIAGKGVADPSSMMEAIILAARLAAK